MSRILLSILMLGATALSADEYVPIYDENEVPEFTLPDPLVFENGEKVEDAAGWRKRQAELRRLFSHHVYGKTLQGKPEAMHFESRTKVDSFLDGKATLEEIRIHFTEGSEGPYLDVLLIKPTEVPESGVPTFVALNFRGNHSIHPSPEITITENWVSESRSDREAGYVVDHKATEKARGFRGNRWPVEMIIDSGAALATFYYGDIDPDFDDEFQNGIHQLFGVPGKGDWGSIGAWAWAASRVRDFLETDDQVDQDRVAVFGHSRLGKTALWAGAQDDRFALTISNNSGCGGAALSRRRFGERVSRINTSFPHWFCKNFHQYNEKEEALPVDQHQLIAMIAPRRVYVASAEGDKWADPKGEFLAAKHASPVFEMLGKGGIGADSMPGLHEPVGGEVRYHIRAGKHDVTDYDWEQYLKAIHTLPGGAE